MVSQRTLQRLHHWIWMLIYAGLFAAVTGYVVARDGAAWGWALLAAGVAAVLAGGVLVWVRSRLHADAA